MARKSSGRIARAPIDPGQFVYVPRAAMGQMTGITWSTLIALAEAEGWPGGTNEHGPLGELGTAANGERFRHKVEGEWATFREGRPAEGWHGGQALLLYQGW
jgi:hypothetical protein